MLRSAVAIILVGSIASAGAVMAAEKTARPAGSAAAANTRIMLFNQTPAASYSVRRNNVASGNVIAAPWGVLVYEANVTAGDRFEFLMTGVNPVTPAAPSGFAATGDNQGCVSVAWNPPVTSDYVTGYSLLWKTGGGAFTDSVAINAVDISKGTKWVAGHCGFASGTYAFALRAHNSFDRWSPLPPSSTTAIGNQDTQGPVPPTNVKVVESAFGCATIAWSRSSDPVVTGYRVYFGARPRSQAAYTDSLEVGNAATTEHCGLAQGNYYFSVRAYSTTGVRSAYSKEVALVARGTDTAAPTISQRTPAPGATNVARNTGIFFVATDDKTGVNASSISITVNGVQRSYTTSPATGGLAVQCDPAADLPADSDVQIALTVADLATQPNVTQRTYSFHTGMSALADNAPPAVSAASPRADAAGVDLRPTIEVHVTDTGLGVDLSSLAMTVNGATAAFSVAGDPANARIRFRPAQDFTAESTVRIHVDACDRAQPANCTALDYEFSVRSASAALAGHGAIVPDGFWANDPSRPMEVRDLPGRWTVRIFDTSGAAVRRHENENEGATWLWDFRNDKGQRVAPALYLVRITDAGGAVQRSGRFLVQSPR